MEKEETKFERYNPDDYDFVKCLEQMGLYASEPYQEEVDDEHTHEYNDNLDDEAKGYARGLMQEAITAGLEPQQDDFYAIWRAYYVLEDFKMKIEDAKRIQRRKENKNGE